LSAAKALGAGEALLVRADGLVTEGSFTSVFVESEDGELLTPPARLGLLPGVLRAQLLAQGKAREAQLTLDHVAKASQDGRNWLGNALRGLCKGQIS
jgi:para-aminobenzoate synthetase/4-amino-4-deoxychorismate lyase